MRHDGSISTPIAGLPGSEKEVEAPAMTRRASSDKVEAPAVTRRASNDELSVSRRASFDKAMSAKSASPTSETRERGEKAEKTEKPGFFVCWLCRRKFDSYEKFDCHVLYSRLHQETIRQLAGLA
mmetsp:Transcript_30123/g.69553  ORF Transcript_30123/g.69553 Transcript_30123/m.69553 type:complete len:125 (-) Transcript_30123:6-380(-)